MSCKIIADLLSGLKVLKIYSLNCFLVLNFCHFSSFLLKMYNLCPLDQCDWAVVNFVSPPSFLSRKRSSSSATSGQVNRPQFGTWTVSLRRKWWSTRIINTLHHKHTLTLSHQLEASRWTQRKHYYTTQVWHYSAVTFSLCTREQKPLTGTTLMTTLLTECRGFCLTLHIGTKLRTLPNLCIPSFLCLFRIIIRIVVIFQNNIFSFFCYVIAFWCQH